MKHKVFVNNISNALVRGALYLRQLEVVLMGLAFLGLYLVLANYALGGPLSSDILGYMNASLHNTKGTYVLNRYFHILLQKIFLELAPDPLTGVQHYWAFLTAGTVLLIYAGARWMSNRSTFLHGILATVIFFSMPPVARSAGIAFVDTTAMFMVALLTVVYIISLRKSHSIAWLIALWGCLLYLAFRTKEVTLIVGILIPGFGFHNDKFSARLFWRNLVWMSAGFLAGILIFAIWNGLVLGDFLFGLRLSELRAFRATYIHNAQVASPSGSQNWYDYLLADLWLPFLFYLVSSIKLSEADPRLRFIWPVPLLLIAFLTITINNQWGLPYRYFMPALPIMAMISPQFLVLRSDSKKENTLLASILLPGTIAVYLFRLLLHWLSPQWGWDITVLLSVVVEPILLTLFLVTTITTQRLSTKTSALLAILLIALLITPVRRNYKTMLIQRPNWESSQQAFYPFSAFKEELQYTPHMRAYVVLPLWETVGFASITKNLDEVICAYNVYFNAYATRENFYVTWQTDPQALLNDILTGDYTHVLLRLSDWQNITEDFPQAYPSLTQRYDLFSEPGNLLVLLKAKTMAH